ncbi:MAG: hypothetical protein ACUVTZ_07465 [Armatimonadota bacterium]
MIGCEPRPEHEAEFTSKRLRNIGTAVLAEAAANGARATAFDGSLATGRVWPSSDVDVTIVTADGDDWNALWSVRDGIVVHMHTTPVSVLSQLLDGYPESFVHTALHDWFLDSTWLLDGLATLLPVHDPDGLLKRTREFVSKHRFAPEVVEPRRLLLLQHARRWRKEAEQAVQARDHLAADWKLQTAVDALAFVWLESAGRIVSHKELDLALAEVCSAFGRTDAHVLFRVASGASKLHLCLTDLRHSFSQLLQAYTHRLDSIPLFWPEFGDSDPLVVKLHYHRHRIHSACCALERGCYMHAARIIADVERQAARAASVACEDTPAQEMANHVVFGLDVSTAREGLLAAARRPSLRQRLKALCDLEKLTRSLRW